MPEKKSIVNIKSVICLLLSVACIAGVVWYAFYAHSQREKEKAVPAEIYDIGEYVIKVLDLYLEGSATREDTIEKLEDVKVEYEDKEEADYLVLSMEITSARANLLFNEISKVKESRNEIAEMIGYR